MKLSTKLGAVAAALFLAYGLFLNDYMSRELKIRMDKSAQVDSLEAARRPVSKKRSRHHGDTDTLSIPAKRFIVIGFEGVSELTIGGFIEFAPPPSPKMNHTLVLNHRYAATTLMIERGDTLFIATMDDGKMCDMKIYTDNLKGVECRSRHHLSFVGVKAEKLYVQSFEENVRFFDHCQIGTLSTLSNRISLFNGSVIDELQSDDDRTFQYRLDKGSLVRSHSYYTKRKVVK